MATPQGVLCLEATPGLLLATGHTSVIRAGEKPKSKYKEAVEVESWGEAGAGAGGQELLEVKGETLGWETGLGYDEPADLTMLGRSGLTISCKGFISSQSHMTSS